MSAICIIPARSGSRRIPRKNIKMFHGKPIIAYSIETAKESNIFDRIVVSTDDPEISEIAKEYGAEVFHRPAEMARDEIGTQDVTRNALLGVNADMDEIACCLYPTAPLINEEDLQWATAILMARPARYVVSVNTDPLQDAGAFYIGNVASFILQRRLYTEATSIYCLPLDRCCDINTPEDWARAEAMYAKLHDLPMTATEVLNA